MAGLGRTIAFSPIPSCFASPESQQHCRLPLLLLLRDPIDLKKKNLEPDTPPSFRHSLSRNPGSSLCGWIPANRMREWRKAAEGPFSDSLPRSHPGRKTSQMVLHVFNSVGRALMFIPYLFRRFVYQEFGLS